MIEPKTLERFWSKVERTGTCWIWKGSITDDGYGRFEYNYKHIKAHRFAFEITKYEIPKGLDLDHLCRNRSCVNPEHLEPVTRKENLRRGIKRNQNSNKQTCNQGHALIKLNDKKRGCRICIRKYNTNYQRIRRDKKIIVMNISQMSIAGIQRQNPTGIFNNPSKEVL